MITTVFGFRFIGEVTSAAQIGLLLAWSHVEDELEEVAAIHDELCPTHRSNGEACVGRCEQRCESMGELLAYAKEWDAFAGEMHNVRDMVQPQRQPSPWVAANQ